MKFLIIFLMVAQLSAIEMTYGPNWHGDIILRFVAEEGKKYYVERSLDLIYWEDAFVPSENFPNLYHGLDFLRVDQTSSHRYTHICTAYPIRCLNGAYHVKFFTFGSENTLKCFFRVVEDDNDIPWGEYRQDIMDQAGL